MQVDVKLSAAIQEVFAEAEKLGLKIKLEPQFDVTQIDLDNRVQVRTENVAPAGNVEQYANHLKSGVKLPAPIVTLDGYIVDGNTRFKAFPKAKISNYPVLVIQANFKGAPPAVAAKIRLMGAAQNQKGAQRLKPKEAKRSVLDGIALGLNNKRIMETTGLSISMINKVRRQEDAKARMTELAILPATVDQLDVFGTAEFLALHDEPYRRLVLFTTDAGLSMREAKGIAKEMAKARSEQDAIDIVTRYRAENADRIKEHSLTGNGKPSVLAKFKKALGAVLAFADDPRLCVERKPDFMEDHLGKIETAVEFLDEIRAAQQTRIDNPEIEDDDEETMTIETEEDDDAENRSY